MLGYCLDTLDEINEAPSKKNDFIRFSPYSRGGERKNDEFCQVEKKQLPPFCLSAIADLDPRWCSRRSFSSAIALPLLCLRNLARISQINCWKTLYTHSLADEHGNGVITVKNGQFLLAWRLKLCGGALMLSSRRGQVDDERKIMIMVRVELARSQPASH